MFGLLLRVLRRPTRAAPLRRDAAPRPVADQSPRRAEACVARDPPPAPPALTGKCHVIDGDTIIIRGTSIRIAGIDAPELHHPWGKKARYAMIALCGGKVVTAVIQPGSTYNRTVAKCYLEDGTDLAAELVRQGLALDWRKYSGGAYRHLEPDGVRKRHWRAAAKQQGKLPASEM